MDVVIQVRNRGVITLPADLREKYGIENGDIFRLVDLDGVFVLTPMVPMVPELAREIEQVRLEAGLSIEDLLQGLREQRQRYVQEKYGAGKASERETPLSRAYLLTQMCSLLALLLPTSTAPATCSCAWQSSH
jgi:bifunctional DNA-binding transcriptional regulator/antitoxin component of YhaV-PrlF toxin-antitoxin module